MRLISSFLFVILSTHTWATMYSNGINNSSWTVKRSVFECRLEHEIPYLGDAVFRTRAGESSVFFLDGQSARFRAGKASIYSSAPAWHNDVFSESLASVTLKKGRRPLWLGTEKTELMLSELSRGRELELIGRSWYNADDAPFLQVVVSNIGFQEVYKNYLGCLSGLLPANYDQLKRTALYFNPGISEDLPTAVVRQLDHILQLVKHDKKLGKIYIDGHTSSDGDRAENLELSKMRAELVAAYLASKGITEDRIVTRWHGERYPVASNGTAAGRAKNRRVTVRLEKMEDEPAKMAAK